MKKCLGLMGAAVLIMAFATPGAAQMLTKSWGHLEVMTVWENKIDFNTGAAWFRQDRPTSAGQDVTHRQVAERFRFNLQHGDDKTVKAIIGFEANSKDWGEAKNTTAVNDGNQMGTYGTDQVALMIRHAYLEFVVPNTPVVVAAGLQLFTYGGRLFMNNDAPGLKITTKFAPHQIEGFWWRENDASRITYQVNDVYGLEYRLTQKTFNAYAWGAYRNAQVTYLTDHPYWLGVGGGTKAGNLDLSGQLVYVGGTYEDRTTTVIKKDYSAFAFEAAGKYQIGPGMFAGLEVFYSTGNDANSNDKINMYQVGTGSEARAVFGNDRTVIFWMNAAQLGYWHNRQWGFEGMYYGRVNFEFSPTAKIRFNVNYLYIGDTSSGNPGTGKVVNSPIGARQDKDEDFVGHEINLITTIQIYKNLIYNIGLGYFIPGSIYDKPATSTPAKSAESCFGLNTDLRVVF